MVVVQICCLSAQHTRCQGWVILQCLFSKRAAAAAADCVLHHKTARRSVWCLSRVTSWAREKQDVHFGPGNPGRSGSFSNWERKRSRWLWWVLWKSLGFFFQSVLRSHEGKNTNSRNKESKQLDGTENTKRIHKHVSVTHREDQGTWPRCNSSSWSPPFSRADTPGAEVEGVSPNQPMFLPACLSVCLQQKQE